jgi:chromosome segregation ATPase
VCTQRANWDNRIKAALGANGKKMTLKEQLKVESPSVANKIRRLKAANTKFKSDIWRYQTELAKASKEIERLRKQLVELA